MTPSVIDTSLHPLRALRSIRVLLRNPDDTRQVFVILRAMRGRSAVKMLRRFQAGATGAAILRERRPLLPVLQDHQALAGLPDGSLGRFYLAFMMEQALSAEGLVAPSQIDSDDVSSPEMVLLLERLRDMHDLTHVLTGYGRDPLGELCLLAFMYAQNHNLGQAMIVLMGVARTMQMPGGKAMIRAIFQAWRDGGKAHWLGAQDWEALLARPLDAVRHDLSVSTPTRYLASGVIEAAAIYAESFSK